MILGQIHSGVVDVAIGGHLDLVPDKNFETVIHNVYHSKAAKLVYYDRFLNTFTEIENHTSDGSWQTQVLHNTTDCYYRVINMSATEVCTVGFDGLVTYEAPNA